MFFCLGEFLKLALFLICCDVSSALVRLGVLRRIRYMTKPGEYGLCNYSELY